MMMFAKELLWVTAKRMANRDNVTKQDHLILESVVAFRALEGHLVAVNHLLVRPQSVLGLELLVTHLTRSLNFSSFENRSHLLC